MTQRYGAWTVPGARETARLAWRARVDRRAGIYARTRHEDDRAEIALAVACHRPWRSPRRPDPRRRYSRSHRRACWDCIEMTCPTPVIDRLASGCRREGWTSALRDLLRGFRDPHGRRS